MQCFRRWVSIGSKVMAGDDHLVMARGKWAAACVPAHWEGMCPGTLSAEQVSNALLHPVGYVAVTEAMKVRRLPVQSCPRCSACTTGGAWVLLGCRAGAHGYVMYVQLDKGCLTRPHAGAAFFCLEQAAQDAFATLRPGLTQHAAACKCLVPRVGMDSP